MSFTWMCVCIVIGYVHRLSVKMCVCVVARDDNRPLFPFQILPSVQGILFFMTVVFFFLFWIFQFTLNSWFALVWMPNKSRPFLWLLSILFILCGGWEGEIYELFGLVSDDDREKDGHRKIAWLCHDNEQIGHFDRYSATKSSFI